MAQMSTAHVPRLYRDLLELLVIVSLTKADSEGADPLGTSATVQKA